MGFSTTMLVPLVLLLPAAGALEVAMEAPGDTETGVSWGPMSVRPQPRQATQERAAPEWAGWDLQFAAQNFQPDSANQVRIEQRMTIRISPRPAPVMPNMLVELPDRPIGPRFVERKMGDCVSVSGISGVQTNGGDKLLLFMRDQRIVSARLERACRARDFYSGFYLANSSDGKLCVDRDILQSRSGANCKLTQMKRLVETDD